MNTVNLQDNPNFSGFFTLLNDNLMSNVDISEAVLSVYSPMLTDNVVARLLSLCQIVLLDGVRR